MCVSLTILVWVAFPLRQHLNGLGITQLHRLLSTLFGRESYITILATTGYIYFALTILPNIIPISLFAAFGVITANLKLVNRWWKVIFLAAVVAALDLQSLIFDLVFTMPLILRADALGTMMALTSSFIRPFWALAGYVLALRSHAMRSSERPRQEHMAPPAFEGADTTSARAR